MCCCGGALCAGVRAGVVIGRLVECVILKCSRLVVVVVVVGVGLHGSSPVVAISSAIIIQVS